MRLQMRRRGIVPFAFAVSLTVAAGLSLAEEHAWVPAAVWEGADTSSDSSSGGVAPHEGASAPTPAAGQIDGRTPVGLRPGVGSRALSGHETQEPATDERRPN